MGQQRFWDRIAAKYSRQPITDQASYQKKLETTRALFTPDTRIIELGAGTGSTAIRHAPHVAHIHLVDLSEKMLAIARQKAEAEGIVNLSFEQTDLDNYHYTGEPVDMVMCMSLLHLVEDKDTLLEQCFQMLKPGGHLVTSTICMKDGFGFLRPVLPVVHAMGLVPLVRFFSQDELLASIRKAGFDIEEFWRPDKKAASFIVARKTGQ